jgi:ribosomal protein S18 acetylase RimI-like enzyme
MYPEFRGSESGTKLMVHAEQTAKRRNLKYTLLDIEKETAVNL